METCQKILKQANFPTNILLIDFETYFDNEYNLKKMSTVEYVMDKRFECLGFGIWESLNDDSYWINQYGIGEKLIANKARYGNNFENVTLVVQNAFFDPLILIYHYGINPQFVIDIRHLDRHVEARASHKLEDMVVRWNCSNVKGDTSQFKGLHWNDISGEPKYELPLIDYTLNDVELEKELFLKLLPKIINPEIELPLMNHTNKLYLYPKLKLNMTKARTLIPRMNKKMNECIQDYDYKEISGTISFTKKLINAMPKGEKIPLKKGKPTKNMIPLTGKGLIPAISKSDPDIDKLRFHKNEEVSKLINARLAIKSWPNHIKKLQNVIRQAKVRDNYLGIPLNYYGGHLGRWSGAEGINVQNFAERVDPLMGEIKKCIEAPPGYILILIDLSQIECRYLAYLSGQKDLLHCFEIDGDPYSEFATKVFKEEVRKPNKENDSQELYDKLFLRRYIGKQAVLGLGYGMGWERFFTQVQEYEVVRKLVKGGEIEEQFAKDVVKLYRDIHKNIIYFWDQVEHNFKWVIKYPHDVVEMGCGLKFWKEEKTVRLRLLSGRILNYPQSSYRKDSGLRWKYGVLWGGTITENIIQACARDIFAGGMLECEEKGIHTNLHIHDKLIACVKESEAKEKLELTHKILTTPPKWCEGLPLDTDRKLCKYYE